MAIPPLTFPSDSKIRPSTSLSEQVANLVFDGESGLSMSFKRDDLVKIIDVALTLSRYRTSSQEKSQIDEVLVRSLHVGTKL